MFRKVLFRLQKNLFLNYTEKQWYYSGSLTRGEIFKCYLNTTKLFDMIIFTVL